MSCERFREEHQRQGKPLKIVGGTDAWPARRWNVEGLRARFAEREVLVRKRTDSAAYRLGQASAVERMAFGAYCDTLSTTEGASHYLAASNVRHLFPELREDFEEPRWLAANGRVHSGPFLWIAASGHYEFTHLDPDCGFLAVISGRKRVRLWPSHLVHELYPNPLGADGRTIQSAVDLTLDATTLRARFPAFVPEAGTEVMLEAGDLLYIPAFTWHQVSSLEQSISINFFWGEQGRHAYVDKVLRVCPEAFFFWILNVVEQNRTQPAFLQVLRHFDDAMRIFLKQQWAEELEERHLRLIRTRVFEHLMASRTEADSFYALGDIRQPKVLELSGSAKENDGACKAGRLKIRGLRSRGEVEFNGGRNAKRQPA